MFPSKYARKSASLTVHPVVNNAGTYSDGRLKVVFFTRPRRYSHIHLALLIAFMTFCVECTANPFFYISSLFSWKRMNKTGSGIYQKTTCESNLLIE